MRFRLACDEGYNLGLDDNTRVIKFFWVKENLRESLGTIFVLTLKMGM